MELSQISENLLKLKIVINDRQWLPRWFFDYNCFPELIFVKKIDDLLTSSSSTRPLWLRHDFWICLAACLCVNSSTFWMWSGSYLSLDRDLEMTERKEKQELWVLRYFRYFQLLMFLLDCKSVKPLILNCKDFGWVFKCLTGFNLPNFF